MSKKCLSISLSFFRVVRGFRGSTHALSPFAPQKCVNEHTFAERKATIKKSLTQSAGATLMFSNFAQTAESSVPLIVVCDGLNEIVLVKLWPWLVGNP